MISVECHTNVDDLQRCRWPDEMTCRPMIGDRVQEEGGGRIAYVVGITHATRRVGPDDYDGSVVKPILLVELHTNPPTRR